MAQYHESIGERIRRVRLLRSRYMKDKKCSLDNFSNESGVKLTRIKKIESGEIAGILLEEGQQFSRILRVSPEYITTGKKTLEDDAKEKILFAMQIGSMVHAARMRLKNKNKTEGSLKVVANKLGVTDMDLLRIENLNKAQYYNDEKFLQKLSRVLKLNMEDIKNALETSFPRGAEKRKTAYKGKEVVIMLKQDSRVVKINRYPSEINEKDYENLIKRLEFELKLI